MRQSSLATAIATVTAATLLLAGCKGKSSAASDSERTAPSSSAKARTFKVGETVNFDKDSTWTVVSAVNLGQTLPAKKYIKARNTTGRFVIVDLRLRNDGNAPVSAKPPTLVDSADRTFERFGDEGDWVGDTASMGGDLTPGIERRFSVIYEVPSDAKGLRLRCRLIQWLSHGHGPTKADVDLGLDLSAVAVAPAQPTKPTEGDSARKARCADDCENTWAACGAANLSDDVALERCNRARGECGLKCQ